MSIFVGPVPDWLQWASAAGQAVAGLTIFGAVVTFVVQWLRRRKDRKESARQAIVERERFEKQIDALERAENERLAAQARKVISQVVNASAIIPNLYHVGINNFGTEIVSALQIEVFAKDGSGDIVPDACQFADQTSVSEAMADVIVPEIDKTFDIISVRLQQLLEQAKAGSIDLGVDAQLVDAIFNHVYAAMDEEMNIGEQKATILKEQVKHQVVAQLYQQWPQVLAPGQWAVMPFLTTKPEYSLRVDLQFDDSNYTWSRIDGGKPRIVSQFSPERKPAESNAKRRWWQFWR
jgi:hypothetical protein